MLKAINVIILLFFYFIVSVADASSPISSPDGKNYRQNDAMQEIISSGELERGSKLEDTDAIIFTANQEWLSRIYILDMNGNVVNYFEYEFYRFVDLAAVNNELYAAEAFAPRLYKVDLNAGDLEVIIDDWSLYYFYDVAFDGTFFYATEWDLNRYYIDGEKEGTASYDEDVWGAAWDGEYYWTLTDSSVVKCWTLDDWPAVAEIPENSFQPPSEHCRGLWFDGNFFWTAESIEGTLGKIYRFDCQGEILLEITAPAFQGWGACVIEDFLPSPTPTVLPSNTPLPSITPTSPPSPTPSPTSTLIASSTPAPSHSETFTPCISPSTVPGTDTPVPPSPTPQTEPVSVMLWMPSNFYYPNDVCSCNVFFENPNQIQYENIPLFVVLEVFGEYYFAPDFSEFNYYEIDLTPGTGGFTVVEEFLWPENAGSARNIMWFAAFTNYEITDVRGIMDSWTFGWGE